MACRQASSLPVGFEILLISLPGRRIPGNQSNQFFVNFNDSTLTCLGTYYVP
jgi:hypothetical protein